MNAPLKAETSKNYLLPVLSYVILSVFEEYRHKHSSNYTFFVAVKQIRMIIKLICNTNIQSYYYEENKTIVTTSIPLSAFCQNSITFKVEELSKPKNTLWMQSYDEIYKYLISSDVDIF